MNWMPVTECLPRDGLAVLVTYRDMYGDLAVTMSRLRKGQWIVDDYGTLETVRAWMRLPRPYTGEA
jgi:hypothetical protein